MLRPSSRHHRPRLRHRFGGPVAPAREGRLLVRRWSPARFVFDPAQPSGTRGQPGSL